MDQQLFLTAVGIGEDSSDVAPLPVFTPLDLDGTVSWFDASNTEDITKSGDDVTSWADRTGSGRTLEQDAGATAPHSGTRTINSLNVIDFDGGQHFVTGSAVSNFWAADAKTIWIVAHLDTNDDDFDQTQNPGFWVSTGARFGIEFDNNPGGVVNFWHDDSGGTDILVGDAYQLGSTIIYRGRHNGTTLGIEVDGSEQSRASGDSVVLTETVNVGKSFLDRWVNGALCEIVVSNVFESDANLALMDTYLKDKWGIT